MIVTPCFAAPWAIMVAGLLALQYWTLPELLLCIQFASEYPQLGTEMAVSKELKTTTFYLLHTQRGHMIERITHPDALKLGAVTSTKSNEYLLKDPKNKEK